MWVVLLVYVLASVHSGRKNNRHVWPISICSASYLSYLICVCTIETEGWGVRGAWDTHTHTHSEDSLTYSVRLPPYPSPAVIRLILSSCWLQEDYQWQTGMAKSAWKTRWPCPPPELATICFTLIWVTGSACQNNSLKRDEAGRNLNECSCKVVLLNTGNGLCC